LWAGTFADGVYHLREGRLLRHYGRDQGMPGGHVRAIAVDGRGGAWIGTRRGLMLIDDHGVHPPPSLPGLPQGLVTALAWVDGRLWIGSVGGASVVHGDGRVERIALEAAGGDPRTVFGFQQ